MNRLLRAIALVTVAVVVADLLGAALAPTSANATDGWDWGLGDSYHSQRVVYRRSAKRRAPKHLFREPAWIIERDEDGDKRPVCLDSFVKVTSTEHTTSPTAMEAARKAWAWSTQWDWGSKYMDLKLAADYREFCGQSNAMDTATGRLNEAVSQIAGKEGVNVRCIIRARPCRAVLGPAEGLK